MAKQLEMVFLDSANRQYTLRVDEPRADLTETEIQTQMAAILAANVFQTAYGDLASVVKANLVSTDTQTFTFA